MYIILTTLSQKFLPRKTLCGGGIMVIPDHPITQSPHLCDRQSALPPHNFGNIASFTSLSLNQGQHSCVAVSSILNFFDFKKIIS